MARCTCSSWCIVVFANIICHSWCCSWKQKYYMQNLRCVQAATSSEGSICSRTWPWSWPDLFYLARSWHRQSANQSQIIFARALNVFWWDFASQPFFPPATQPTQVNSSEQQHIPQGQRAAWPYQWICNFYLKDAEVTKSKVADSKWCLLEQNSKSHHIALPVQWSEAGSCD